MVKVHISLRVRNVSESARFYEAFFGQPPHKVRPGYANFDLEVPPLKLALNEMPSTPGGSLDHFGVVVESREDVEAAKERMRSAGLTMFSEEEVTCCYATQDKVWVTDPDGHSWEVYVLLDDAPAEAEGMTMLPVFRQAEPSCCCES